MWQQYDFLAPKQSPPVKPVIGMSACLAGEHVRYNGEAKTHPELLAHLSPHLQILPLCPEVAIGMGVPRDPIQLVQTDDRIEALPVDEGEGDYTDSLEGYAEQVARHHGELSQPSQVICGYIFKSRSPSCGLGSSPVFHEGNHLRFGDGIYAHRLCQKLPWLVVMEDDDLDSPSSRDYFIFRAMLIHDFHVTSPAPKGVARFYQQHAPLVEHASHSEQQKLVRFTRGNLNEATEKNGFLRMFCNLLDRLNHREVMAIVAASNRSQ